MLADFLPDFVKPDMELVRKVNIDAMRQTIGRSVVAMCGDFTLQVVAEGVETRGERKFFNSLWRDVDARLLRR